MKIWPKLIALISLFQSVCLIHAQVPLPAPYNATTTKFNYIRTWEAQAPVTDPAVLTTKTFKDAKQSILYADGLGRPVQAVQRQASLITSSTAVDLVAPVLYDTYGREVLQ